jgi:hypothetical protein
VTHCYCMNRSQGIWDSNEDKYESQHFVYISKRILIQYIIHDILVQVVQKMDELVQMDEGLMRDVLQLQVLDFVLINFVHELQNI